MGRDEVEEAGTIRRGVALLLPKLSLHLDEMTTGWLPEAPHILS